MLRLLPLILIVLLGADAACEDSVQDQIAQTDLSNADSVFALAVWCKEHRMPTSAQKYFEQVLKLDTDHEGARQALGFVRVGERWVPRMYAPAPVAGAGGTVGAAGMVSPPGPTAEQIRWDLTLPPDPDPSNTFINKYIDRLPTIDKEGEDMDISVATCIDEKYWPMAMPRLCAAMLKDSFTDLYGVSTMVMELGHKGRAAEAKHLIGFMMKASKRISTPQDLDAFCWALSVFKDKRAVPRLIEFMQGTDANLAKSATQAVAAITHMPVQGLDAAKAQLWWNDNCNITEQDSLHAQLNSSDDQTVLEAVRSLYALRDKQLMPALIRLLHSTSTPVRAGAIDLFARITNSQWGYDAEATDDARAKVVAHIESWWKENGGSFSFPVSETPASATHDPCDQWVHDLDSSAGTTAIDAERSLRQHGMEAVPALLDGLGSSALLTRQRSYELLKAISGQSIPFNARDGDEERTKAIALWQDWWKSQHPAPTPK